MRRWSLFLVVRVVLTYLTAMAWLRDEVVRFAPDICGRDGDVEPVRRSIVRESRYQRRRRPVSTCTKLEAG